MKKDDAQRALAEIRSKDLAEVPIGAVRGAMAGDERPGTPRLALLDPPVSIVLEEGYDRPDFPRPVLAVLAGCLRNWELQADLLLRIGRTEGTSGVS